MFSVKPQHTYQPLPMMDVKQATDMEKGSSNHNSACSNCNTNNDSAECQGRHCHGACHRRRRRRLCHLAASALTLISLLILALWYDWEGFFSYGQDDADGSLWKRQSNNNGSPDGVFVKNKLYLIVVLVGLFLCLVLAIMLSAWCCRGAFENPLCCPCYLCACCGGLACLECISCGLCVEGIEDLGVN